MLNIRLLNRKIKIKIGLHTHQNCKYLKTLKIPGFSKGVEKQDFSYMASGNINGIPLFQKTIWHSVQS